MDMNTLILFVQIDYLDDERISIIFNATMEEEEEEKTLEMRWWSNFSSRLLALMSTITAHMLSIFLDLVRNSSNTSYHRWPLLTKSMLEDNQLSLNTFVLSLSFIVQLSILTKPSVSNTIDQMLEKQSY